MFDARCNVSVWYGSVNAGGFLDRSSTTSTDSGTRAGLVRQRCCLQSIYHISQNLSRTGPTYPVVRLLARERGIHDKTDYRCQADSGALADGPWALISTLPQSLARVKTWSIPPSSKEATPQLVHYTLCQTLTDSRTGAD
jgi:hypothetical protein